MAYLGMMKRNFRAIFIGVILWIAMAPTVIQAQGQNDLRVVHSYLSPTLHVTSLQTRMAIDPEHHQLYIAEDSVLYKVDLDQNHPDLERYPLQMEMADYYMSYDTVRNRLLIWSRGVGNLYQFDETIPKFEQLDDSFDHKNQYGHSPSINPSTGELCAFGGYGLWTSKNYITRYDEVAGEWFVFDDQDSGVYPKPRMNAYTTWKNSDELLMIGGGINETMVPHRSPATTGNSNILWTFNRNTGKWHRRSEIALDKVEIIARNRRKFRDFNSMYSYCKSYDLWFLAGLKSDNGNQNLLAIETETGRSKYIDVPNLDLGRNKILLTMAWDPDNRQLLLAGVTNTTDQDEYPVFLSRIEISDPSIFKADMVPAKVLSTDPILPLETGITLSWSLFLLILGFIGGMGVYWAYQKSSSSSVVTLGSEFTDEKHQKREGAEGTQKRTIPDRGLYVDIQQEKLTIYHYGQSMNTRLSDIQCQILLYFFIKTKQGVPYISIDEIEDIFWSDQQNRDYIRKLRNREFNRILEVTSHVTPASYQPIITHRRNPEDKRRLEYGLNPKLITDGLIQGEESNISWHRLRSEPESQSRLLSAMNHSFSTIYLSTADMI
jgi:hypothetical protein